MADTKISDLTAIAGASLASTDLTVVVDVSDTTMAASGTDKKTTVADLATAVTTIGALATDAEVTAAVSAHTAASDPHGDRAFAASAVSTHEADTTSVHGITDTSTLYRSGGTDVAVADGGTGSSTASGARTNLGLVIGTDVQAYDADLTALAAIAGVQGDVIYHNGTAWVKLPAGTSGQFLKTLGAGANPAWAAAGGGGTFPNGGWRPDSATTALIAPGVQFSSISFGNLTSQRMYFQPIQLLCNATVDAMVCGVTIGAGTAGKMGLYAADAYFLPSGAPLIDVSFDPSTTGQKTSTISPVSLTPGLYVMAIVTNGATQMRIATGWPPTWTISNFSTASIFYSAPSKDTVDPTIALPSSPTVSSLGVTGAPLNYYCALRATAAS